MKMTMFLSIETMLKTSDHNNSQTPSEPPSSSSDLTFPADLWQIIQFNCAPILSSGDHQTHFNDCVRQGETRWDKERQGETRWDKGWISCLETPRADPASKKQAAKFWSGSKSKLECTCNQTALITILQLLKRKKVLFFSEISWFPFMGPLLAPKS